MQPKQRRAGCGSVPVGAGRERRGCRRGKVSRGGAGPSDARGGDDMKGRARRGERGVELS